MERIIENKYKEHLKKLKETSATEMGGFLYANLEHILRANLKSVGYPEHKWDEAVVRFKEKYRKQEEI